jgi:threonine/homoserine/homoserine lactone efflux protein
VIPLDRLLAFLGAAVLVTLAPGPDILYVLARGVAEGRRVALAAAAGFASGVFVHTLLAVVGLSALIAASPTTFRAVKFAGAAYLIYVGVRMWLEGGPTIEAKKASGGDAESMAATPGRAQRVFRQSILANVLNPKVTVFFLSFLPQFVDASRGAVTWQFATLGLVFAVQAWACFSVVALAAGGIGDRLRKNPRVGVWLMRIAGGVLIALGIALAWQ